MARLDACYFCGTASDAPIREVSISPRARRGDPDATVSVTLCESCEDKLERVLGGLFDHVESRGTDRDEPVDRIPDDEPADESDGGEDARLDRIDVASGGDGGDGPRRGRRRLFSEPSGSDGPAETASAGDEDGGGTSSADEDAEIIEDEPTVHARATASAGEALDGVSIDEYNRVMRLLQNRRFPMARGAFVDLAASAYDLGEDTVQTVIDAVIDQGTLAERDGELVRPDGDGA